MLITKGAVARVQAASAWAELADGKIVAIAELRDRIEQRVADLSAQSYRVLAVACRDLGSRPRCASRMKRR